MSKRIHEPVEVTHRRDELDEAVPQAFRWRDGAYVVIAVLGHWREDAAWWSGAGLAVPQRDLWRVEARRRAGAVDAGGDPARHGDRGAHEHARGGVYELVCEPSGWRLDRVWD